MRDLETLLVGALLAFVLAGCGDRPAVEAPAKDGGQPAPVITNRIDVPPAVRKNLGITFAKVEMRDVRRIRRVPGSFELLPQAHRAYHSTLAGHVVVHVEQYQEVKPGDVLFVVRSPAWREMQQDLAKTVRAIRMSATQLKSLPARAASVDLHIARLRDQEKVWKQRLAELEGLGSAGGGIGSVLTEARAQLASVATSLAEAHEEQVVLTTEKDAVNAALESHLEATPSLYAEALRADPVVAGGTNSTSKDLALSRAAALLGVTVDYLQEHVGGKDGPPRWRVVEDMRVEAKEAGVIESLEVTNGAWIEAGAVVVESVNRSLVRFRAASLQADLDRISDGLSARILPPGGVAAAEENTLSGTITIAFEADPRTRKIDLLLTPEVAVLPNWARPGVSTEMEIVLTGTAQATLAVPRASVIQDGLEKIIFRRDPKDPNKVIRLAADLGISDGRWVVIESGVMEGDEIVHHGVYELMLASGSAKQEGGHFHSDGTFHVGDDH